MTNRELASEIDRLEDHIRPLLAGHHPAIQGGTLACLLACWLAGHLPAARQQLLQAHMQSVRDLVPVYEARRRPVFDR